MFNLKNINKYKISVTIFAIFLLNVSFVLASTNVYFNSDTLNIKSGDVFSIDLKVSSDNPINTVDGTLTYDNKKLFVREVKTSDSIFSMWVKSPSYDNSKGKITFTGGVPGGFTGKDGQVVKITFRALDSGNTKIDFQDIFSVFLNDGLGTKANLWMEPITLSIATTTTETLLVKTLQVLSDKNIENNNLPAIVFLILILMISVIWIKQSNKKSAK